MTLQIVPCSIKDANEFVARHHRHNDRIVAGRIALAVADETGIIRGVGIAALPVARMLSDGWTLEARRVCTDGAKNACSMIYGALWRAARAMGYRSMITYTLVSEPGTSLRALGWIVEAKVKGESWDRPGRRRKTVPVCLEDKYRWRVRA